MQKVKVIVGTFARRLKFNCIKRRPYGRQKERCSFIRASKEQIKKRISKKL